VVAATVSAVQRSTAAPAASAAGATPAAARLAARTAAQELRDKEEKVDHDKFRDVSQKLCLVLLDDENADADEPVVSDLQLDSAFVQYTYLLGASPTALQRHWKTGQTVLGALNGLHSEDEMKVFSGIQTRKGYDLYLQIVRDLSKGNQQKVSAKATAIDSNAEAQGPPEAAEQIRCEFGYIGTKDAQRHADRLTLRVEQTQYAGLINDGLLEFGSSVKELSCPVLEVELDTEMPSWMQHGVGGPAAKVLEPSAVRPAGKRSAPADSVMDHAETKNHCFLCSLNGQSPAVCAIMAEDGPTYLTGHRKDRKAVVCEWFDSKFPAGDSERERRETARKAKYNALRSCRRAKKRPTGAAGGTG
jgi:hypothetical protein